MCRSKTFPNMQIYLEHSSLCLFLICMHANLWFLFLGIKIMCSRRDGPSRDTEEAIYVALGKEFKKDSANLLWVLANFPTARIVFLHVHWPSKWMPFSKFFKSTAMNVDISEYTRTCCSRNIRLQIGSFAETCILAIASVPKSTWKSLMISNSRKQLLRDTAEKAFR